MSEKVLNLKLNSDLKENNVLDIFFRDRMRSAALQAAALNHEFYTPLTIIKGMAESLIKNPEKNPQNYLKEIVNESEKLLRILESLNFSSSIDGLKKQRVSIKDLVTQTNLFFAKACLEKGISVQVDIDEKLMINTEPYRFKSVLGAILQNAVESFDGRRIHKKGKSITFHVQQGEKGLVLLVSDTGAGMSDSLQKKVRSDILANLENFELGSSLGLSLASYVARDLQIDLDFVSEKEFGTTFTLTFLK